MPLPSFFNSSKGHSQNRASSSLSPPPNSISPSPRPTISAPLAPSPVPPNYSGNRVSSTGATVQLVPIDRGAAELSNNNNNSDNNPSPPTTSSSYSASTRKLLHRERHPSGPPSPQPESTSSSISRRISLSARHHKPPPIQHYQQQQQQSDNHSLDPYLQHSPVQPSHSAGSLSRPQSMLPSPLETEIDTYTLDSDHSSQHYNHQQQHHEGYQHHPGTVEQQQQQQQHQHQQHQHQHQQQQQHQHQQQQQPQQQGYFEQSPQQQYQQDYQQQQQQQNPQQQQEQQGNLMTPAQQHNQPRRSMDAPHQPAPPSREVSALGQQGYTGQGAHQGNRGTDQHPYQNQGGAAGAGGNGQPQPYDQTKFEGQPMGRMTPEQARTDSRADSRAPENLNIPLLIQDHDTLQGKYRKVKNLYFESKSEIERLQNTIAHQRLSQSRTSLDDNEYISRFERLDGAIKNVAFEIRQSWKTIPLWLGGVINSGAELKGGREMTVVGRASISRWVVDEILEQFFHPALDVNLSSQLKIIEQNIRKNTPIPQSTEEDDALSTRVCNWRLTTLDALQSIINGKHAMEVRVHLAEHLVKKLVDSLQQHLHEPAPVGLLGGVQMIVDIAVGLAANLPLESREVKVWYPLPGDRFDTKFMKPESGLPPLVSPTNQKPSGEGDGKEDNTQTEGEAQVPPPPAKDDPKTTPSARAGIGGLPPITPPQQNPKEPPGKKTGGFSGRMKKALQGAGGISSPPPPSPNMPNPPSAQQNGGGSAGSQVSLVPQTSNLPEGPKPSERVRVAGFMAVEVRGRSILVKAPVWL